MMSLEKKNLTSTFGGRTSGAAKNPSHTKQLHTKTYHASSLRKTSITQTFNIVRRSLNRRHPPRLNSLAAAKEDNRNHTMTSSTQIHNNNKPRLTAKQDQNRPETTLELPNEPLKEEPESECARKSMKLDRHKLLKQDSRDKLAENRLHMLRTSNHRKQKLSVYRNSKLSPLVEVPLVINPKSEVTVSLCRGNNSELVKNLLLRRRNVVLADQNELAMFHWSPTTAGFRFQSLSKNNGGCVMFNHHENHKQITNKEWLTRNLQYFCEKRKMTLFEIIPPTFILNLSDLNFDANAMKFVAYYSAFKPENLKSGPQKETLVVKRNAPSKVLPPANTKNNSARGLRINPTLLADDAKAYLWLLKPTSLNRGRGIHVFQELQQVEALIQQYSVGRQGIKSHSFVVQKYIQRPMLIKGRKFDIRAWVLLDQHMNVYFYREGYVRTSSQKYSAAKEDINNEYIHLTNNAVQKKASNYGKSQSGNQLSFSYLREHMKTYSNKYGNNPNYDFTRTIAKMKELVALVFESVEKRINCGGRKFCYELLGFDFMIDETGKVWLIQVNTNPCLQLSSPLLEGLIPKMLNDALRITFDKVFGVEEINELNEINSWERVTTI